MFLPIRPAAPRRGLSLLEVLVALTIFLLSFVALGRLVTLASDHALDIQQQSQATRLAQSKLNEVIAGAVALQSAEGSFDEDPEWQWSVEADQSSGASGLWTVTVTVTRPGNGGPEVSTALSQMVFDPTLRGSVFDQLTVTGANDTATSGGGASSSQGSSGAGAASGAAAAGPSKPSAASPAKGGPSTPAPAKGKGPSTPAPAKGGPSTPTPAKGGPSTPTPAKGGPSTPTPAKGGPSKGG